LTTPTASDRAEDEEESSSSRGGRGGYPLLSTSLVGVEEEARRSAVGAKVKGDSVSMFIQPHSSLSR
jgi:hypothetical protein